MAAAPNTEFTLTPARIGAVSSSLINTESDWDISRLLPRPSCTIAEGQNCSQPLPPTLWDDNSSILSDPQTQNWQLIEHPMPCPGLGSAPVQNAAGNVDGI